MYSRPCVSHRLLSCSSASSLTSSSSSSDTTTPTPDSCKEQVSSSSQSPPRGRGIIPLWSSLRAGANLLDLLCNGPAALRLELGREYLLIVRREMLSYS